MSCCGDIIKKGIAIAGKVGQIVGGSVLETADDVFQLPTERHHMAEVRKSICRQYDCHTWMTESEFWAWVDANGGRKKFYIEIAVLSGWPLLTKQDYQTGRFLMCRICKCWIGKKSQLKQADCSKGLWPHD